MRDALFEIAGERKDWAGIPMPLADQQLVIEPTFPNAQGLMSIGLAEQAAPPTDADGWTLRNQWFSRRDRCDIIIMEKDGKVDWGKMPAMHHISMDLGTLGCADAWGIEQESKAVHLLAEMVTHRQFRQYMLTGMFIETSRRSGIQYIFRRLKPTVAIAAHPGLPERRGGARILCTLCMHPIAYYAGTWAGAMVPTDDVIAHLALMRGDERLFWARCNQHPPYRPEAGL